MPEKKSETLSLIHEPRDLMPSHNVGISALKTGKVSYTSTGNAFWDLFFLSDISKCDEVIRIQRNAYICDEEVCRWDVFCRISISIIRRI